MELRKVTSEFPDMHLLDGLALEAFPPEEYLAPAEIIEMSLKTDLDFWGLYDKDSFIGFCVIVRYADIAYLFFLAITPENRSKGYGSTILATLSEQYKSSRFVVDFEMIEEQAPNAEQRIRRKDFYLRNGFRETGHFLAYFGVSYEVLCKNKDFDFQTFKKMLFHIPIDGFNPVFFT